MYRDKHWKVTQMIENKIKKFTLIGNLPVSSLDSSAWYIYKL